MDPSSNRAMLELFKTLSKELQKTYNFSEADLVAAIRADEHLIPATAFANELTPFETAVRYLESQDVPLASIAKILDRAPSVVTKTLEHSYEKQKEKLTIAQTEYFIPARIFADKKYSFSEHLCLHLKTTYNLTNTQIATLVKLDPRTVWTVLHRASKRGEAQ